MVDVRYAILVAFAPHVKPGYVNVYIWARGGSPLLQLLRLNDVAVSPGRLL